MVTPMKLSPYKIINMKKNKILVGLLFVSSLACAQNAAPRFVDPSVIHLASAKLLLNPKAKTYNPNYAFKIYQEYAGKGNAKAMNGLGNLYNKGLGTAVNETEALSWYEKAANAGYAGAWFNLGNMYKSGIGTTQDFKKAYLAFSKGAALNDGSSLYGLGYMHYKGFGTQQNYTQAAELFKKGARIGNISSWYMLGLCYRNGYGIIKNPDSAKYYLGKAAAAKDQRAIAELRTLAPENTNMAVFDVLQAPSKLAKPIDLKTGFKKVSQNVSRNTVVTGEYTGHIIKFDWSGKHIISQSNLRLNLEQKKDLLTGLWEEDGQDMVFIKAKITDTALVFNQTQQAQSDHYHRDKKQLVNFQQSQLHVVQSQDTIFLSGNVTVYSPKAKEPEKPRLIMLVRAGAAANVVPLSTDSADIAAVSAEEERLDALALNFIAYPNPIITSTNLKYTLRRAANVSILVTDALSGRTVYRSQQGLKQAGDYTMPLTLNQRPGNYVLTLQYNQKIKSLIIIKI